MSLFLVPKVFKPHILKWRADNDIVFKHIIASWCSWCSQSWIACSMCSSCLKKRERRKFSNEQWWKWRMVPVSMTETRLFWMNCNMLLLLTPGSTISILLSSGSLAKIITPIIEVTILISSSLRSCLNNILTTAKYKKYKLFRPFPSPFD